MANFLKFLKKEKKKDVSDVKDQQSAQLLSSELEQKDPESKNEVKKGLFTNLRKGLQRTRSGLVEGLSKIFLGKKVIDATILEEIETQLMLADVGVNVTKEIIDNLTRKLNRNELNDFETLIS